ncbi:hypothetical protein Y032_0033g2633 [Ancylostoma ceylanicum]|uniref:Uncharacterized protein n=1 Tax=Ancylostoma ceylanicum TaxID=53326 RepID=A0A016UNA6_9BILA|nr:hypothetical protein Y032_0033g2633 [Ancylostoma ceylanicum]
MMLFSLRENENDEVESGDGDVASSAADKRTDPGEEVGTAAFTQTSEHREAEEESELESCDEGSIQG